MEGNVRLDFQPGGPLRETAVYVRRKADELLSGFFVRGEFCHVLASRQVGKTSLVRSVARRLRSEDKDIRVVDVDLSTIGSASEVEWFFTLAYQIAERLDCDEELSAFWKEHAGRGPANQWRQFLEKYLPSHLTGKVIVVFDEVGALQSLPFSCDPFFAIVRSVGDLYLGTSAPFRLSFCMIGIAIPGDLLQDPAISPFYATGQVVIADFSREDLDAFLPPLKNHLGEGAAVFLDAIFGWTNGQPYMTQRLCALLAERGRDDSRSPEAQVDWLVEETFLRDGRIQDAVLNYVERFVSKGQTRLPQEEMLDLYRSVLRAELAVPSEPGRPAEAYLALTPYRSVLRAEEAAVPSEPGRPAEAYLTLAGLVAVSGGSGPPTLTPRNRIFAKVFDLRWIREKETERIFGAKMLWWLNAAQEEKKSHLLRGDALERARNWAETHDTSPDETRFLHESDEMVQEERAKAEENRHTLAVAKAELGRARAAQTLRHVMLAGAAILFFMGLIVYYARESALSDQILRQEIQARFDKEESHKRIVQALVNTFSKNVSQSPDDTLVAAIGLQAESPEALAAVRPALTRGLVDAMDLRFVASLSGHTGQLTSVRVSPDGTRVLTGAKDGTARLWSVKTGESTVLQGHTDAVTTVAFSDDGKLAATGSKDNTVRLWDGVTGAPLANLPGHTNEITVVAFSPGPSAEALLASTSDDGTVILRRARDGSSPVTLRGRTKPINAAEFSRDGQWLATGGEDATVVLWNVKEKRAEKKLEAKGTLRSVAFSPDGSLVAAGGTDGATRVWQRDTGKLLHELRNEKEWGDQIWSIAFSHKGDKLVAAGLTEKVIVWDAKTGTVSATLLMPYEGKNIVKALFSPDDGRIATACSSDGLARLWSAADGSLVAVLQGHQHGVVDLDFSRDGQRLFTASWDKTAKIWNARDGRPLLELDSGAPMDKLRRLASLAYAADGGRIAAAGGDGVVRVWSAAGGAPVEMPEPHDGLVNWVAFGPAGTPYVASAGVDKTAHVYDVATRKLTATLPHAGAVRKVIFSRDGSLVVTAGNDKLVKLWRRDGERWVDTELRGHTNGVGDIAFSPDQTRLVSGDDNGDAMLWSMPDGSAPTPLNRPNRAETGLEKKVRSVAFSPDGRRIVTATSEHVAHLWDGTTGALLRSLEGHSAPVLRALFLPDSKRVATASWDLSARIWDADTGAMLFRLSHTGPVTSLAMSSDGKTLATTSADGFLWLWDTADHVGDLIAKLPGAAGQVWQAEFSPDGGRIATANEDGFLRIYAATLDGFLSQACRALEPRTSFIRAKDACATYLQREP